MSYFDHIQCHSCGARMDPEQLVAGPGEMPACPHCSQQLNVTDLFGVKDAFVGVHDDLGNDHTLDDLVGGELFDGRYVDGRPPSPQDTPPPRSSAPRAHGAQPPRSAGGWQRREASGPRALPGPSAGSQAPRGGAINALIRKGSQRDAWEADDTPPPQSPAPSGNTPSAADLLREMRRKK